MIVFKKKRKKHNWSLLEAMRALTPNPENGQLKEYKVILAFLYKLQFRIT